MKTHELAPHPAFPAAGVRAVTAKLDIAGPWLTLRWRVEGSGKISLPPFTGRKRRDGLWQATCFELFVQPAGAASYAEFNFSPSESWAAYDFTSRREGMMARPISHDPVISPRMGRDLFIFDAALPLSDLPALPASFGMTCVIEEDGQKSYWAMKHGADQPDFHDPACFAGWLAAPDLP